MTELLHFHFSLSCTGEGNGNPLQCSCLENPRDRAAWWAAIAFFGSFQSIPLRQSDISFQNGSNLEPFLWWLPIVAAGGILSFPSPTNLQQFLQHTHTHTHTHTQRSSLYSKSTPLHSSAHFKEHLLQEALQTPQTRSGPL